MAKARRYPLGAYWPPRATFLVGTVPTDPTRLTVVQEDPNGIETILLDDVDVTTLTTTSQPISRLDVGVFRVRPGVEMDKAGWWYVRFKGTGSAASAQTHQAWAIPDEIEDETQTYVALEELKDTLEASGTTYADPDMQLALVAASRALETHMGRRFYLDDDALTVRVFTASEPEAVRVDDLTALTSVTTDLDGDGVYETAWVEGTDFVLEPVNAPLEARPWTTIRALRTGRYRWPSFPNAIRVEGQFGWAQAPAAIKQATTIIASRLLRRTREAPFGIVAIGVDGAAVRAGSVINDPELQFLLAPYKRTRLLV